MNVNRMFALRSGDHYVIGFSSFTVGTPISSILGHSDHPSNHLRVTEYAGPETCT